MTEEIFEKGRQEELLEMTPRNLPVTSAYYTYLLCHSLLKDAFYDTTRNHGECESDCGVVIDPQEVIKTSFDLVYKALSETRSSVNIFTNVMLNPAYNTLDHSLTTFYSSRPLEVNVNHITYRDTDAFDEEILHLLMNWLVRSQFVNTYIFRPENEKINQFVYVQELLLMFYVMDEYHNPMMMSYTRDERMIEEMETYIRRNILNKNLIIGSEGGSTVESDVFGTSLVEGNEFIFQMSFLETFFLKDETIKEMLKKRKICDGKVENALWSQHVAREISENFPLTICYQKQCLNRSLKNREILLGPYLYKLSKKEMKEYLRQYIEYLKGADNIKIYIGPVSTLPYRRGSLDFSFFCDKKNVVFKQDPSIQDRYTHSYLTAGNMPANEKFFDMIKEQLEEPEYEEYSREQFIGFLEYHMKMY